MAFKNDMTMMYATHDALRRDLDRIARITTRADDDPKRLLRTAQGWGQFTSFLHVHHSTEDDLLWPVMRQALAGDTDGTAVLDAMEAEHAAIDPLLAAIDGAVVDPDAQRLGELTERLGEALRGHLEHEESEALALIDATVSEEQWQAFAFETGKRVGDGVQRFFPWVLDGATPELAAAVLALVPPPMMLTYRDLWQPAYDAMRLWP